MYRHRQSFGCNKRSISLRNCRSRTSCACQSCRIARTSAIAINTSTKLNGRANTMVAVCTAFRPPAISNAKAMAETRTPQIILVRFFGFTSPSVLIVANTKVAESPEVMKKITIKIVATIELSQASGNSPNKANNAKKPPTTNLPATTISPRDAPP